MLGFFDNLNTRASILDWVRQHGQRAFIPGPHRVALAAHAGDLTQAQEWLDMLPVETGPPWVANSSRREAARIAGRLGLTGPAPTDAPSMTPVFRVGTDTTPANRHTAFHQLDRKFSARLSEQFADITWQIDPAAQRHG